MSIALIIIGVLSLISGVWLHGKGIGSKVVRGEVAEARSEILTKIDQAENDMSARTQTRQAEVVKQTEAIRQDVEAKTEGTISEDDIDRAIAKAHKEWLSED